MWCSGSPSTFLHTPFSLFLKLQECHAFYVVLDRVRHFRPIPIHRFFAVNRCRYRCDTDVFALTCVIIQEGTWLWRGAVWLTDQRLPTPPPQLITAAAAPRAGCAAADAFDLCGVVHSQTQQLLLKFNIKNSNDLHANQHSRILQ